jgi:hypothetical protein
MTAAVQLRASALTTRKRTLGGSLLALVAALALALGVSTPSSAASGAQIGEWDVIATSQSQSPKLQSYEHGIDEWDTVFAPSAWFAVGAGKFISKEDTVVTPVSGGGIRFTNAAASARTATFGFTIPANVGLVITDGTTTPIAAPPSPVEQYLTWSPGSVAADGEYHEHFDWTFSGTGLGSSVDIDIDVVVVVTGSTTVDYTDHGTYRFTF